MYESYSNLLQMNQLSFVYKNRHSSLHVTTPMLCRVFCTWCSQKAKYVERWPNTTSTWAGWSRFDIPVDRYGGVHSQLLCTSRTLGSPTCHQASQQENTYWTKYQKADRANTLVTLWVFLQSMTDPQYSELSTVRCIRTFVLYITTPGTELLLSAVSTTSSIN